MNCIENHILQKYLDGEINPDEKIAVDKHLQECQFCMEKMERQRSRAHQIKSLLNYLADEKVVRPPLSSLVKGTRPIPEWTDQQPPVARYPKSLIYSVCAAAVLVLIFLFPFKSYFGQPQKVVYLQTEIQEVDANRPLSDQETVISVINPDGKVSDLH
jgi:predicted anti-sigma-YlaC factor YlaD